LQARCHFPRILAAAQQSGARYLLSEDFQAGRQYDDVRVLNPSNTPHPSSGIPGSY